MAFYIDGKLLPEGVSFYDANGTQYPSNWLNQSTEEQKATIGITWVVDPTPFDTRFYWDTNLPKALEDKLEDDGSTTKGLKTTFKAQVNPYLESVQQRQGLYAFRVIMDDSNNTPTVIDQNQMVGQIYLQPTKTAEFIYLDFNITPTGATFPA